MRKFLLAALVGGFFVSGCAALQEGNADAKLVTQYATLKVADGDPAKAARIAEIASEVRRYVTDAEALTVDALIVAIRAEVNWSSLDAADTLLVNALLERLRVELIEYLGPEQIPEDLRLAATTVADWVIEATAFV